MVLAFITAEVASARFGALYQNCFDQLKPYGFDRELLVDVADIHSSQQNTIRKQILKAIRGYGADQLLFRGFPSDVLWRRVGLEPADLNTVKYANYPTWVTLSGGTRIVADGAKSIDSLAAQTKT